MGGIILVDATDGRGLTISRGAISAFSEPMENRPAVNWLDRVAELIGPPEASCRVGQRAAPGFLHQPVVLAGPAAPTVNSHADTVVVAGLCRRSSHRHDSYGRSDDRHRRHERLAPASGITTHFALSASMASIGPIVDAMRARHRPYARRNGSRSLVIPRSAIINVRCWA